MSVRAEAAAKSAEVRRQRLRRLGIRLGLWVGLPTVIAIAYYGVIAAPQYNSVAVVAVHSPQPSSGPGGPLDTALSSTNTEQDGYIVREYILSREMVRRLVDSYQFIDHYSTSGDWFSSLDSDAPFEDIYRYYSDRVEVEYRSSRGTMKLRVRAFSPEAAHSMASGILTESQTVLARLATERPNVPRTKLITISQPSLPDAPSYPRRLWSIATVFFVALALTAVIGLFAGAVREHAKL